VDLNISSQTKKETGFKRPTKFQRRLNQQVQTGEDSKRRKEEGNEEIGLSSSGSMQLNLSMPPYNLSSSEEEFYQRRGGYSAEEPQMEYYPTTIFVGDLREDMEEDELERAFSRFGKIDCVRLITGKNFGFIKFMTRDSAQTAITGMNGESFGGQRIRVSKAKVPSARGRWERRPWNPSFANSRYEDPPETRVPIEYTGAVVDVSGMEGAAEANGEEAGNDGAAASEFEYMARSRKVVQYDDL